MANVSIDGFAAEMTRLMREYTDDVTEGVSREVDNTAKAVCNAVKAGAPKDSGKYAAGWGVTKQGTRESPKRIVWNKKYPGLPHLLEFGHAMVGGGRVSGRAHIRPAYEAHGAQLPEHIARIIQRGGG